MLILYEIFQQVISLNILYKQLKQKLLSWSNFGSGSLPYAHSFLVSDSIL